jgi:hypothetical protein
MGLDFTYRKIFIGNNQPDSSKEKILGIIEQTLIANQFSETPIEEESDWSFILTNENTKWLHLADAGWMQHEEDLSISISQSFPIINIHVSEEILIVFSLFVLGKKVNQFANSNFFTFDPMVFNKTFDVKKWQPFLSNEGEISNLENAWKLEKSENGQARTPLNFNKLLHKSFHFFGWDDNLAYGGYYLDSEGMVGRGVNFWLNEENAKQKYQPVIKHYKFIGKQEERKYATLWESLGWEKR